MIINHPLLGPRDASEFVYLGDACLINRPAWVGERIEGGSDGTTYETIRIFSQGSGVISEVNYNPLHRQQM